MQWLLKAPHLHVIGKSKSLAMPNFKGLVQILVGRRSLGNVWVWKELLQSSNIGLESFGFVSLHDDMLKIFVLDD